MLKLFVLVCLSLFMLQSMAQLEKNTDSISTKFPANLQIKQPVKDDVNVTLKIYPNPAKNKITLEVNGFEAGLATVKIIDAKGKVWREDSRLLNNGKEEIAMFLMLPAGIYFISVSEKEKIIKKKLVVL